MLILGLTGLNKPAGSGPGHANCEVCVPKGIS